MAVVSAQLLTVAEVAARAAVSAKTVRREIDRGELLATKIGRCLRIPEEAFGAWIADGRVARGATRPASPRASSPGEVGSLARLRAIEGNA